MRRRIGEQRQLTWIGRGLRCAGHDSMLALQFGQHFPRALDHRVGQSRQLCYVHAIGTVGATRLQSMQEHHAITGLAHHHVHIPRVGKALRQLHQLMIVRREHRLAAHAVVQVLAYRPRDGDAVIRGRAPADLIQEHQAPSRGTVKDRAGLAHLHHER